MPHTIKKFIFVLIFNTSLLTMLILGIQNSSNKNKVNFILNETVQLPVSFIIGVSFISGSILGSYIKLTDLFKKE
tara:strand:+ start:283 stop:507 length:225 start_codon:yes stop_codon:yes gene_type:complete